MFVLAGMNARVVIKFQVDSTVQVRLQSHLRPVSRACVYIRYDQVAAYFKVIV
jgi:hypothetical protein